MYEDLRIIKWPDPRLVKTSQPVERFDENLAALVKRMLDLMREYRGVGLAAPQVGLSIRLFVMNPTGKPEDDLIYVNPVLKDPNGEEESEEGCLSLPDINIKVMRSKSITLVGQDIKGQPTERRETGYLARIWQHETDHLDGTLLTDKMGPLAKLANRKTLKELEEKYYEEHPEAKRPKKKR